MKKYIASFFTLSLLLFTLLACQKEAGPGGTSSINGYLHYNLYDFAGNIIETGPSADERVYIIYGEDASYSEYVRTNADGYFQFKGLRKGDYAIYMFSESIDFSNPPDVLEEVRISITIDENKSAVQLGNTFINKFI